MTTDICRWLFRLFFVLTWITFANSKEVRVVCYYTNWSVYRPGQAKFSPQNINPYLCTHLIYAFGGFTKENTLKPFDKYQDVEKGGYAKFTGLKTYNKNLKTMLAIGGWNEGSSRFSPMVANGDRRKELVKNTVKFLRQNHFDGLDLDWEYPSFRDGGKSRDKDNYAQLVQELREEFERESEKTGRPRLLLTMAVPAGIEYINKGYDVPKLMKYLDWMNILSYDYHSAFEPAVNHHAPLYSLEEASEYNYDAELNIDYTIKHYMEMGAERNKLVLGIPTYGRSYTLFNPEANDIGAPADGPGDMGDATRENGYLAYYEICENIKSQDWEVVQPNPKAMGPYAYKDNQWVGYDDEAIAKKKAEYVAENGLGGIMFWSIDNDDFRGNCHGRPYPIIEAAKEALINAYGITDDNSVIPVTKPTKPRTRTRVSSKTESKKEEIKTTTIPPFRRRNRIKANDRLKSRRPESKRTTTESTSTYSSLKVATPSYTTPAPPSTPDQGGVFKCEDEGFYPHPKDCKKYYWCLSGPGELGIVAHQFTCPAGLYFNKAADSCDYTRNVLCNKKLSKSTTTTTTEENKSTTTTSAPSTTRVPPRITAATSRTTLFRSRTTTTTPEPSFEDEYEEYEDDADDVESDKGAEEDPRVIKELLDLIKKAGGIEELEKQLKIQEDGSAKLSSASTSKDTTTPPTISKSLVQRVLSKSGRNNARDNSKYNIFNRNSRGPQNEGLTKTVETSEEKIKGRVRPQYTTISRQRTSTTKIEDEDDMEEDDKVEKKKKVTKTTTNHLEYVNIRRGKVNSDVDNDEEDDEEDETDPKVQSSRNKVLGEESEEDELEVTETPDTKSKTTPQYVNIRRQRPSTTEGTTSKYTVIRRGTTTSIATEEEEEGTTSSPVLRKRGSTTVTEAETEKTTPTYKILRRSTTPASTTEEVSTTSESSTTSKYKIIRRTTTEASTTEDNKTPSNDIQDDLTTISSTLSTTTPAPITEEVSISSTTKHSGESSVETANLESAETTKNFVEKSTESEKLTTTTTESNTENDIQTITSTEKRFPLLYNPRPFSLNSRTTTTTKIDTTATTTKAPKVSEFPSRFGVRKNEDAVKKLRGRRPFRVNGISTTTLANDLEPTNSPSFRTRKRFSTTPTTETYVEDLTRNYRPSDLADLSSLTAVDIDQIKDLSRSNGVSRQRRPRPTFSTTTEKITENTSRTTIRPSGRRFLDNRGFGSVRRINQISTSTKPTEPSSEGTTETSKAPFKNRRIIRRFRPTTSKTVTPEDEKDDNLNRIALNRKRFTRLPISTSTEAITALQARKFPSTTTITTTTKASPSSTTEEITTTLKPTENTSIDTTLASISESNDITEKLEETTTEEEEENIKLSESNIRENNDVNNGNVITEDGKVRKKLLRRVKSKSEQEIIDKDIDIKTTTPSVLNRRRKIIRKFKPTESTTTSTIEPTNFDSVSRRYKIIRRLRPTTPTPKASTEAEEDEVVSFVNKLTYKSISRTTTEKLKVEDESDLEDKKKSNDADKFKKPNKSFLFNKSGFKPFIRNKVNEEPIVENTFEKPVIDRSKYKPIIRSTTHKIIDKIDEDEDNELTTAIPDSKLESEDIVTKKYRIYRPTTLQTTTENLDKLRTIFNSDEDLSTESIEEITTENEIPDNDGNITTNKDLESEIINEISTTTDYPTTAILLDEDNLNNTITEEDLNITTTSTTTYRNPIFERQKNRPAYIRPKFNKNPSTTESNRIIPSSTPRSRFRTFGRSTTENVNGPKPNRFKPKTFGRTRYGNSRTSTSSTTTSTAEPTYKTTLSDLLNGEITITSENIASTESFTESSTSLKYETTSSDSTISTEKIMTTTDTTLKTDSTTILEKKRDEYITTTNFDDLTSTEVFDTTTNLNIDTTLNLIDNNFTEDSDLSTVVTNDDEITTIKFRTTTTKPTTIRSITTQIPETTTEQLKKERTVPPKPNLLVPKRPLNSNLRESFKPNSRTSTTAENKITSTTRAVPRFKFTTPLPLRNRFLARSTTEKIIENNEENENSDENEPEIDKDDQDEDEVTTKKKFVPKLTKTTRLGFKSTTELPSSTESLVDIDIEAVKNRNKNLFSKKRKMNTPYAGTSTTLSLEEKPATIPTITESVTKPTTKNKETTEYPTTLHHVFAELINENTTILPIGLDQTTAKSKIERLIEINRIVEVHDAAEAEKAKEKKKLDKIGAINRVTVIKVVDGNKTSTETNPEENEIHSTTIKPKATLSIDGTFIIPEILNSDENERQDKKYEIYGDSKVLDYNQLKNNKNNDKQSEKVQIANDGASINIITPMPLFSTEASTIALQGLFQTESPAKVLAMPSFVNNEELLETENTRYVNVRVLDQDPGLDKRYYKDNSNILPIKILPQDDEITMRAKVVEIKPRSKEDTIRIAPIQVSMTKRLVIPNDGSGKI